MRNNRTTLIATVAFMCTAARIAEGAPSAEQNAAEIARLQAEVREQRQLLMQLIRVEQEHYQLLLKLIQAQPGKSLPAGTPGGDQPAAGQSGSSVKDGDASELGTRKTPPRTVSLRGKVEFPGGSLKDVYVYIDNVKSAPARGRTVEIAQKDKQFVPEVAVVQRGTRVLFPNYDTVFHNVFSPTAPHPFDLGSYRAGDTPKSVELNSPGVVDLFCNVHSRMRASVLVVPNALYARVGKDGAFRLDGVPVGTRKVVVWGPRSKPASETVEVGSSGADVSFTLLVQPQAAHNNKLGQPYSSYKD